MSLPGEQILLETELMRDDEERKANESEETKRIKNAVIIEALQFFQETYANRKIIDLRGGISPGRVNLIGEHVDYCDGFVLPIAIPMYTVVIGAPALDEERKYSRLKSSRFDEIVEFVPKNLAKMPHWASYVVGVFALFPPDEPLDVVVHSSLPMGAGLSSSAALECATLQMLTQFSDKVINYEDAAILCQRAEHEFAGVPCGIMDQFVCSLALPSHALKIDCMYLVYDRIPLEIVHDAVFIAVHSGVQHKLSSSEYPIRRSTVERTLKRLGKASWRDVTLAELEAAWDNWTQDEKNFSKHIVTEIERTNDAATALLDNNIIKFGDLMVQSHESLRDLYRVSCEEIDSLVSIALNTEGVFGARMTGGGFGGCTINLVKVSKVKEFKKAITEGYSGTVQFFDCNPVAGAGPVNFDYGTSRDGSQYLNGQ